MFVLCVAISFAQNATTAKVDKFISAEMQRQKIPGISFAIIKVGQIAYVKGYGFANVEHQVSVKPNRFSTWLGQQTLYLRGL